jgi:hypothetical protein
MARARTCEQAGGAGDVVGSEGLRQLVPGLVTLLQGSNAATATTAARAAAAGLTTAAAAGACQLGAPARCGCGLQRLACARGAQAGGQLAQAVVGLRGAASQVPGVESDSRMYKQPSHHWDTFHPAPSTHIRLP